MRRDDAYLLDMLLAERDAVEFSAGLTFLQFERSRLHQSAILKAIEIIGEAAARISKETKQAHPVVPLAGDYRNAKLPRACLFRGRPEACVEDRTTGYSSSHRPHRTVSATGDCMMGRTTIDRLIVNSPYEEPGQHWSYNPTDAPL